MVHEEVVFVGFGSFSLDLGLQILCRWLIMCIISERMHCCKCQRLIHKGTAGPGFQGQAGNEIDEQ